MGDPLMYINELDRPRQIYKLLSIIHTCSPDNAMLIKRALYGINPKESKEVWEIFAQRVKVNPDLGSFKDPSKGGITFWEHYQDLKYLILSQNEVSYMIQIFKNYLDYVIDFNPKRYMPNIFGEIADYHFPYLVAFMYECIIIYRANLGYLMFDGKFIEVEGRNEIEQKRKIKEFLKSKIPRIKTALECAIERVSFKIDNQDRKLLLEAINLKRIWRKFIYYFYRNVTGYHRKFLTHNPFNYNPYLLACGNGVLVTGPTINDLNFRKALPSDYITMTLGITFPSTVSEGELRNLRSHLLEKFDGDRSYSKSCLYLSSVLMGNRYREKYRSTEKINRSLFNCIFGKYGPRSSRMRRSAHLDVDELLYMKSSDILPPEMIPIYLYDLFTTWLPLYYFIRNKETFNLNKLRYFPKSFNQIIFTCLCLAGYDKEGQPYHPETNWYKLPPEMLFLIFQNLVNVTYHLKVT